MTPIAMIVINHVKPGCEAEYREPCEEVLDAVRHEPQFVNTTLHQDAHDPTRFMLHETWADRHDFFAVQMQRGYRQTYEKRLPELLWAPREISIFTPRRADGALFQSTAEHDE